MKKHFLLILSLLLVAVMGFMIGRLSVTSNDEPTRQQVKQTARMPLRITKIIDGDSIRGHVNGRLENIRLLGIDAPERRTGKKQNRQAKKWNLSVEVVDRLADEATSKLQSLLGSAQATIINPTGRIERDSFGRILAYVENPSGKDCGKKLLESGLAERYPAEHELEEAYVEAETAARKSKYGVWSASLGL